MRIESLWHSDTVLIVWIMRAITATTTVGRLQSLSPAPSLHLSYIFSYSFHCIPLILFSLFISLLSHSCLWDKEKKHRGGVVGVVVADFVFSQILQWGSMQWNTHAHAALFLSGLPGDSGGPGSELQQPGGHPLGDHCPADQCQHPEPGPQSDRKCPWGNLLQPAQAGQVRVTWAHHRICAVFVFFHGLTCRRKRNLPYPCIYLVPYINYK